MEDKLIELLYENNTRLIEFIIDKLVEEGYLNGGEEQEQLDIQGAIQQDKTWTIIVDNDIQVMINQDKDWIVGE